jgi:hypothetical protein
LHPLTKSLFLCLQVSNEMSIMIKKLAFSVLLIAFSTVAFAQSTVQTTETKKGRPNIPGTFLLDFGFNFPSEKADFNTGIFGSRTLNIYYQYDMQIGKSKFSVHPGIGFGLERFKFNNNKTLALDASGDNTLMVASPFSKLKKTQLITNYIDIPLELRFSSNPNDPNRSFKISAGFKFGVLYDSFTKQKYKEDGETKKLKDKQNFNLNPFRYGLTLRVGGGNVSAFAYYSLSPVFKKGAGPSGNEDITNFTVGISLATF